nr:hypothetical protein Iba_chr11eCG16060 [Ipomoea batatas]
MEEPHFAHFYTAYSSKNAGAQWKTGESSGKINNEIGFEISRRDFSGVLHQLAPAENPRSGGDEGGAEFEQHVDEISLAGVQLQILHWSPLLELMALIGTEYQCPPDVADEFLD